MAKKETAINTRSAQSRTIRIITLSGVFIALEFVTEYYLSITFGTAWRIALTFLIRAICGFTLGIIGGPIAAITDILGAYAFYSGSMIPGITVIRFLQGLIAGLILYKKLNTKNIVASAVICTFLLNIISIKVRFDYTGTPITFATAAPSATTSTICCIVEIMIMLLIRQKYAGNFKRLLYTSGIWSVPVKTDDKSEKTAEDSVTEMTDAAEDTVETVSETADSCGRNENVACDPQKAV